jgi:hypothetical protein
MVLFEKIKRLSITNLEPVFMGSTLLEILPTLLELAFFSLGSVLLSLGGAYLERFALLTAEGGQVALGGWVALMGIMAFYFAYLMLTDKVRPTLASLK